MGRIYCGPYAGMLGGHEGYAAIALPDGSLTATWTADTVIAAHVAACACGWTALTRHPGTEAGEDAAVAQWERDHLNPLIAAAERDGWLAWAKRVAERVARITDLVGDGQTVAALEPMRRLQDDVRVWGFVLDELLVEAGR
jgi:hypothetical protein